MIDLPTWVLTLLAVGGVYLAFSLVCFLALLPSLINAPLMEEDDHDHE